MSAAIIDPDFLWPGLIPTDGIENVKFFIVRRPDEAVVGSSESIDPRTEAVTERIKSIYPIPKIVFVKEVSSELIERFKTVKRITSVVDFRPTSIEFSIADHSKQLTKALMMWRNNQPFENPRGIVTCVTIPLYLLEVIRALSMYAKINTSYGMLRDISSRFEELLDIDFEDEHFQPLTGGALVEKTIVDDMGFVMPPRSVKTRVFRHFIEHFEFEAASSVFDLENLDFVSECIEKIVGVIGPSTASEEESAPRTFPDLPYELREFIHARIDDDQKIFIATDDASSQTVSQFVAYAPALVHTRPNAQGVIDVIVIESGCIETQHTIIGHYLGDPNRLSHGGVLYFKNPCPETIEIVTSFEQRAPRGSLFFRLFEAYLRFEKKIECRLCLDAHRGSMDVRRDSLLVFAKTN